MTTATKNCILCFNDIGEEIASSYSGKFSELCCKYLHSSFTQDGFSGQSSHQSLSFCHKCFESAVELVDLNDQMKIYQKRISELVFILSLEILHRRGKSSDIKNKNTSEKKLVEFEVSSLPNVDSWNISSPSERFLSSPKLPQISQSENFYDEEGIDPLLIPILPDDENNTVDDDIVVEEMKFDISQQDLIDKNLEPDDSSIELPVGEENEIESISTIKIENKMLPILKLHRLQLIDGETAIVTDCEVENSVTDNNDTRKILQTVWIKCDSASSYRITDSTTINKKWSAEICPEDLDSQKNLPYNSLVKSSSNSDKHHIHLNKKNEEGQGAGNSKIFKIKRDLGEGTYKCKVCKFKFKTKHLLLQHSRLHSRERPHKCDFCDMRFEKRFAMARHRRCHTGEKPFPCDFCDRKFTQRCHMLQHRRRHTGEKPFKCDFCDMRFTLRPMMIQHRICHTGEKPFECDFCDKIFTQRNIMLQHRRCHTGERPFKCDFCDRGFTQASALKRHKLVHTVKRSFKCDECGHASHSNDKLKQHRRCRHSGLSGFKCRECKKDFKTSQLVRRHYLRVHFALEFSKDCVIENTST